MSMGEHLHGAIWMYILFFGVGMLSAWKDWNIFLVMLFAVIPAFFVAHIIGAGTFRIHIWLSERLRHGKRPKDARQDY